MPANATATPWDRFNHLKGVARLLNRYLLLRHGRSEANEQRIIASDPANATDRFGLSPRGRREVEETIARTRPSLGPDVVIYTSPFLRTRETAALAAGLLGTPAPIPENDLRERFCGSFELTVSENYHRVWERDAVDPAHTTWGAESACAILDRSTRLVRALERRHEGRTLLLVTHCDVAMILACGWAGADLRTHFQRDPIRPGEMRELNGMRPGSNGGTT
jgi:broad specificity phosphatase PhoE